MAGRTLDQNRTIHTLLRQHPEDVRKDILRDHCMIVSGQGSSRQLTAAQADEVIARLRAPPPPAEIPADPRPVAGVTPQQQHGIDELFKLLGFDSTERRRGFVQRQIGLPWPQTQQHADAVWDGLEAMGKRQYPPVEIRARFQVALEKSGQLDGWKRKFLADVGSRYDRGTPSGVWSAGRVAKLLEIEAALARMAA